MIDPCQKHLASATKAENSTILVIFYLMNTNKVYKNLRLFFSGYSSETIKVVNP
jgi:hypothetical protein